MLIKCVIDLKIISSEFILINFSQSIRAVFCDHPQQLCLYWPDFPVPLFKWCQAQLAVSGAWLATLKLQAFSDLIQTFSFCYTHQALKNIDSILWAKIHVAKTIAFQYLFDSCDQQYGDMFGLQVDLSVLWWSSPSYFSLSSQTMNEVIKALPVGHWRLCWLCNSKAYFLITAFASVSHPAGNMLHNFADAYLGFSWDPLASFFIFHRSTEISFERFPYQFYPWLFLSISEWLSTLRHFSEIITSPFFVFASDEYRTHCSHCKAQNYLFI